MAVLKRIGVLSFAVVNASIGAMLGLIWSLVTLAIMSPVMLTYGSGSMALMSAIIMLIIIPLISALASFVVSALIAWLYNITAEKIMPVEIEIKK